MPIHARTKVLTNPGTYEEIIGSFLKKQCDDHYNAFMGQVGLDLSYASCNAAVAVMPHQIYKDAGHGFGVVYGSSRMFHGLDADVAATPGGQKRTFADSKKEEHAEQQAINAGFAADYWKDKAGFCHIYIDLTPCPSCKEWLQARPENWWIHYGERYEVGMAPIERAKREHHKETHGVVTHSKKSHRYSPY